MNTENTKSRFNKSCLVAFRNKKINNFDFENSVISAMSQYGYYFNKLSYVAYDSPEEIVSALVDGRENYFNTVICCPAEMEGVIKNFVKSLYSSRFDELGILKSEEGNAFVLFTDAENRLLFSDIVNILDELYKIKYERAYVKTVGASKVEIDNAISKAIELDPDAVNSNINFNVTESYGEHTIEVVYNDKISKTLFDGVYRTLVTLLSDKVYALENVSLGERVYQLLTLRRMKISVAESFTGGGVGKRLVEIPGISEVYIEGLNTYSNDSKMDRLGVTELNLRHYGAVSEEVAREMAEGLIKTGKCNIAVATTGIAGPKSDNTSKPVGLCYIAVGTEENISVYEFRLSGTRETITNTAVNLALFLVCKTLK